MRDFWWGLLDEVDVEKTPQNEAVSGIGRLLHMCSPAPVFLSAVLFCPCDTSEG